ncbi:MAG: hypothetical protein L0Y72_21050 [Gemmataceae bacterium]|nr:hypothetical protein [Gemmataceae bacterium]
MVNFFGTQITDEALRELQEFKSLRTLDLGRTRVTDAGLKELNALKDLQALVLNDTEITDAGLKDLKELKNLYMLYLGAAPYVIGRLGSDDPELERAAQHALWTFAGGDYGPDAASWRAWWRDPPKNVFGWSVGWTTLKIVVTGGIALGGLSLMLIGLWRSRGAVAAVGGTFLVVAYFLAFIELTDAFRERWTCTFGSTRITYYAVQPVGLEDSKVEGGPGLVLVGLAIWVLIPLVLLLVYSALVKDARGRDEGLSDRSILSHEQHRQGA